MRGSRISHCVHCSKEFTTSNCLIRLDCPECKEVGYSLPSAEILQKVFDEVLLRLMDEVLDKKRPISLLNIEKTMKAVIATYEEERKPPCGGLSHSGRCDAPKNAYRPPTTEPAESEGKCKIHDEPLDEQGFCPVPRKPLVRPDDSLTPPLDATEDAKVLDMFTQSTQGKNMTTESKNIDKSLIEDARAFATEWVSAFDENNFTKKSDEDKFEYTRAGLILDIATIAEQYAAKKLAERDSLENVKAMALSGRDWTEDFEGENGQYQNRCVHCERFFWGYKRRVGCKRCHERDKQTIKAFIEKVGKVVKVTSNKVHERGTDAVFEAMRSVAEKEYGG
jgi:hypothetical protein